MKSFLRGLKLPNGAFMMHDQGEYDTRSAYCAVVVASYLNIMTPDLIEGTGEWLARYAHTIVVMAYIAKSNIHLNR